MLVQALVSATFMLAKLSHAQSLRNIPSNLTQKHTFPDIALVTASIRPPPLITGAPLQPNGSRFLGSGMVLYDNATFATSCAYNDSDCASRCSWHHDACSRTWATWWSTGLIKTMNSDLWTTDTQTVHNFTQSLIVTNGYTYAMGPEVTTWTTTETVSWWDPQLQVVSTLVPSPPCNTPTFSCTRQPWCNTNACTVQGGTVELLFWPSTPAVANHTGSHTTSTASGPVTAVYKNTTLTSPSVYLEYKTAYALNGCSQTVGGHYPGAILALDPDDLFSIDARLDYFVMTTTIKDELHTTSFYNKVRVKYDDLTGLPPASAYMAMPMCFASGCAIITPSLFHPQLVVPTQIREMDPAWATCDMDWRGSWDPPIALSEAETIAVPTMPADPTRIPPVSSRPILDGPAKPTAPPETSKKPSLTTELSQTKESGYESLEDPNNTPVFTYDPLSPSTGDYEQPVSSINDVTSVSPTRSFVQVTTIVQITHPSATITGNDSGGTSTSDRHLAYSSDNESSGDVRPTTRVTEAPSQQLPPNEVTEGPPGSTVLTGVPDAPQHTTMIAGQTIIVKPDGGLHFSNTIISAGGSPKTISSVVYSADSAGALVIISNSPADPSTYSPTNAYEVLSEALSTATAQQPYSTSDAISDTTITPSFSLDDPAYTSSTSHTLPTRTEAVLTITLDSTTLTATQHPSSHGIIQLGGNSQVFNSRSSVVTIGSHTLSIAPEGDGIVVDGSTTATFLQHPTSATVPVSSSSSNLPSVQASGSSNASGTGPGNDNGDENETGEASLPPVTFASPASPSDKNTGGGGGGEVGSGNVDSGSDESGANLSPKGFGWWPWVGAVTLILLANG